MQLENQENNMPYLDIEDNNKHPYIDVMANYHWQNGLPFVYTNKDGQVVAQWSDGSIDLLEDEQEDNH